MPKTKWRPKLTCHIGVDDYLIDSQQQTFRIANIEEKGNGTKSTMWVEITQIELGHRVVKILSILKLWSFSLR